MAKKFEEMLYTELVFDVRDLTQTTTHIYLANVLNKYTKFPEILFKYPNLKYIELSNNLIETIPIEIINFKYLEFLNLKNNRISTIPPQIQSFLRGVTFCN
jgi:Leucine-rich repeat (LRR) protein